MPNQLTTNAEALRLFFTDDVYLVKSEAQLSPVAQQVDLPKVEAIAPVKIPIAESEIPAPITENQAPVVKKSIEFEYLGKNQKGILILVNDPVNKVSSPAGVELLRKLVKAIELTNNDFALVNYSNYQGIVFKEFHEFFNCQLLLSFGVSAQHLGFAEQTLHQLNQIEGTRLIFTTNLHELDSDQISKKLLWATLQTLK